MSRLRKGKGEPDDTPDIARQWDEGRQAMRVNTAARTFLEQVMATGGPYVLVPAEAVMRILAPDWEPPQARDPLADPLTGCMPVTARQ